jgi:type IV pilus assembly protein PilA
MKRNAGLTMIELMIVVTIIVILAAVAIPFMTRNRMNANESSAIAGLRAIAHGEMTFHQSHGEYADLAELAAGDPPYISDHNVATGRKDGYDFEVIAATDSGFQVIASPVTFEKTGIRVFFIDESGTVRYTMDGSQPDATAPELQ